MTEDQQHAMARREPFAKPGSAGRERKAASACC